MPIPMAMTVLIVMLHIKNTPAKWMQETCDVEMALMEIRHLYR